MLRFKAGDRHSPIAGSNVESPYNLSPVGQDVQGLLSPKISQRKIARSPFKVRRLAATAQNCLIFKRKGSLNLRGQVHGWW